METERRDLTPDLFGSIKVDETEGERLAGPPIGFWKDSWIRLKKNRGALASLAILILLFALAFVIGPLLSQYSPYAQDMTRRYAGPSAAFWFGTDEFGRDMWTRVWAGTRVSLYIAFLAAFLDLFVGVTYGAVSGFLGGRVDNALQRMIEILVGIPSLVVAILAMVVFRPGIITISIAIGITGWVYMARIVRGRMLQLKEQEFALASRSLGASGYRLVRKHLLPNSLGPIIVNLMFTIPSAIFAEAFLSFIGLGIQVPDASLGSLISEGAGEIRFHPYLLWFPSVVFCLLMVCFNLLGDGLRDAFDPKMRK
ncbi:MAG TPA: ABC transporter permease [Rubrobacteraceae bacterium]|jgi:oligopeptide transport system permease protein|nr:ABC transporter permease [Rubrobacteraceae bacterium]